MGSFFSLINYESFKMSCFYILTFFITCYSLNMWVFSRLFFKLGISCQSAFSLLFKSTWILRDSSWNKTNFDEKSESLDSFCKRRYCCVCWMKESSISWRFSRKTSNWEFISSKVYVWNCSNSSYYSLCLSSRYIICWSFLSDYISISFIFDINFSSINLPKYSLKLSWKFLLICLS